MRGHTDEKCGQRSHVGVLFPWKMRQEIAETKAAFLFLSFFLSLFLPLGFSYANRRKCGSHVERVRECNALRRDTPIGPDEGQCQVSRDPHRDGWQPLEIVNKRKIHWRIIYRNARCALRGRIIEECESYWMQRPSIDRTVIGTEERKNRTSYLLEVIY